MRVRARASGGRAKPKPRQAVPMYDAEQLRQNLFLFVESKGVQAAFKPLVSSVYWNLPSSHAVKGGAISEMRDLLSTLLDVQPFAMFLYKDL